MYINKAKNCKKHGELTKDQVIEENTKYGVYLRCKQCKLDKDRKWKTVHRKKHNLCSINYKKNNREKVNAWNRQDRAFNPDKYKNWSAIGRARLGDERNIREVLRRRKLSREAYEAMLLIQENKCAICKKEEIRKSRTTGKITRLAIDHCHITDKVRGLLCHSCNTGIGKFKDSIDLLESAIKYLKGFDSGGTG